MQYTSKCLNIIHSGKNYSFETYLTFISDACDKIRTGEQALISARANLICLDEAGIANKTEELIINCNFVGNTTYRDKKIPEAAEITNALRVCNEIKREVEKAIKLCFEKINLD